MIKINELNVEVEFAKEDVGVIGINATGTSVTLQELIAENIKLGGTWKDGDERELPKITLDFFKVESVDALIDALKHVKMNLEYPYGTYPLAC